MRPFVLERAGNAAAALSLATRYAGLGDEPGDKPNTLAPYLAGGTTLLDLMKQAQVNIPLKALVTPSNKNWVFGDLLAHLQEEHTAFTAAKETAHA